MKQHKAITIFCTGMLTLNFSATALAENNALVEETTQAAETPKQPEAPDFTKPVVIHDKAKVNTKNVKKDDPKIIQKVTYDTLDKNDSADQHVYKTLGVNKQTYKLVKTSGTKIESSEKLKPNTITFTSEVFNGDEEEYLPPETITGKDGTKYIMATKTLNEKEAEERHEHKSTTVSFKDVEAGVELPDKKEIEFEDIDTKQKIKTILTKSDQKVTSTVWKDNFNFVITVTDYDADSYDLNGKEVPKDANLLDYKDDLLEYLKLDPDSYTVENITWDGNEYTNENGQVIRKAVASGKKKVRNIDVTYEGDVTLPAITGKTWTVVYEQEMEESLSTVYHMSTTAEYELVKVEKKPDNKKDKKQNEGSGNIFIDFINGVVDFVVNIFS